MFSVVHPQAATKPNIVYILADDLGYGDVQCLNPERGMIKTPCLDKLASQGMTLTDAHSGSSACSPTRYGVLSALPAPELSPYPHCAVERMAGQERSRRDADFVMETDRAVGEMLAIRQGQWKLEFYPGSGGWGKPGDAEAKNRASPMHNFTISAPTSARPRTFRPNIASVNGAGNITS